VEFPEDIAYHNKPAILDSNFAPVGATWRTQRNIRIVWFWPIPSIMWKHDAVHKYGSTQCIALPWEEDWAAATGNVQSEIWACGF